MSQIINSFFYERYVYISQTCFHPFLNPGQRASHTLPLIENGDKTKMRDKKNDKNNQVFFFFLVYVSKWILQGQQLFSTDCTFPSPIVLSSVAIFNISFLFRIWIFHTISEREKKSKANNIMHVEKRRLFRTVLTSSYKTGNFSIRHFAWQPLPVDSEC